MYSNIGKKVQTLAKILGWLLLIAGAIVWITRMDTPSSYDDGLGWIALAAGAIGYVLSWPLYGFGQLVDDTHAMREKIAGETQE